MKPLQIISALVILGLAGTAFGQGSGVRGSTPPGSAQDGTAPSEGAIKGGSILPGESGGMPGERDTTKAPTTEGLKRCYELSGSLREQCLLQEQGASTGGTSESIEKPAGPTERDPVTAPPPLNRR